MSEIEKPDFHKNQDLQGALKALCEIDKHYKAKDLFYIGDKIICGIGALTNPQFFDNSDWLYSFVTLSVLQRAQEKFSHMSYVTIEVRSFHIIVCEGKEMYHEIGPLSLINIITAYYIATKLEEG